MVAAGETIDVALEFGTEAFRRWSVEDNDWTIDPGRYQIHLAASAGDVRSTLDVSIAEGTEL